MMLLNTNTGEALDTDIIPKVLRFRMNMHNNDGLTVSSRAMEMFGNGEITPREWQLFNYLFKRSDHNAVAFSQSVASKDLKMAQPVISKTVGKLLEAGLLIRRSRVGNSWTYWINPKHIWKGSAKKQNEVVNQIKQHNSNLMVNPS